MSFFNVLSDSISFFHIFSSLTYIRNIIEAKKQQQKILPKKSYPPCVRPLCSRTLVRSRTIRNLGSFKQGPGSDFFGGIFRPGSHGWNWIGRNVFSPWDAFTFNEVHLFLAAEMSTTRWMESSPDSFNISNQNGVLRMGNGCKWGEGEKEVDKEKKGNGILETGV